MLVDLIGHDAAAAHLNDAVSHTGQCRVVGNNNDGASGLAAGILQKAQHLFAGAVVQRTGGLVAEQQLGVFGQCAGNGHPLLLAAGKLRREVVQPLAQPHAAQGLGGVQRVAADLAGKFHVFQCGQVLHQVVELEHKAHIVPAVGGQLPGGKAAHVAAVQPDVALVAVVHAAQNVQQGGLARAGGPHDDAELALVHIEIQVVCGSDLHTAGLVIFTDIFKLHKMLHGVFPFCQNAKYFNLNIA